MQHFRQGLVVLRHTSVPALSLGKISSQSGFTSIMSLGATTFQWWVCMYSDKWEIISSWFKTRNWLSAKRSQRLTISQPALRKPYAQTQIASEDREYMSLSWNHNDQEATMRNLGNWPDQAVAGKPRPYIKNKPPSQWKEGWPNLASLTFQNKTYYLCHKLGIHFRSLLP